MDISLTDQPPPLNYAQSQALRYIKKYPFLNNEAITSALAGNNPHARYEVANAVEFLIWQGFCHRDKQTGAITVMECAR